MFLDLSGASAEAPAGPSRIALGLPVYAFYARRRPPDAPGDALAPPGRASPEALA